MFWHWGSITTAKDYIKENGFEIAKDIRVRCSSCGKIHVFEKDFADPETWTE